MIRLLYKDVKDPATHESLNRVEAFLNDISLLKGQFQFREVVFTAGSYPATVKTFHKLAFVPKDVLMTSVIGPGTLTWEYGQFTRESLVATITNKVTARFFVGTYSETNG